jgi:hypothetical protein
MYRSWCFTGCTGLAVLVMPLFASAEEADDRFNAINQAAADVPFREVQATAPYAAEKSLLNWTEHKPAIAVTPYDNRCGCVGKNGSQSIATIEKVLRSALASTGLDFTEAPLEGVAGFVQETYGIPVQLDIPALEEIGVDAQQPVTTNLHNVSLRSALRLMLKPLGLTYIVQNEVLLITTPEVEESELTTCVYDVRDLVRSTRSGPDFDPLIDTIISCISVETWAENGGGDSDIRPLHPGFLVVSQTASVHEEIEELLITIRELKSRPVAAAADSDPNASLDELVTEWNVRQ